jgi:phosphonoacetaldehyde hydrolase
MQRITSQQGRELIQNVKGIIFDLAGTLIDTGCNAPVHAMTAAFARNGLLVTDEIVRVDMGLPKRAHIKAILDKPVVLNQWKSIFNNPPRDIDINRIYKYTNFELKRVVGYYSKPTPYAVELLHHLQANGILIGITTGYSREIIQALGDRIHKAGIIYNNLVCADEVSNPRPQAGMVNKILDNWKIYNYSLYQYIKIGDTVADIQEAHSANLVSCQVIDTCSDIGQLIKNKKTRSANRELINSRKYCVKNKFEKTGAEFYCNNLYDILETLKS